MNTHWNYRVIRHVDHKISDTDEDSYYYSIHEVYYENDVPMAWTEEAIAPLSETQEGLQAELQRMLRCIQMPALRVKKGKTDEDDKIVEISGEKNVD